MALQRSMKNLLSYKRRLKSFARSFPLFKNLAAFSSALLNLMKLNNHERYFNFK